MKDLFATEKPVIGMVHLPPLPGAPGHRQAMEALIEHAVRDARALAEGGVHGVMVENFGDAPFFPQRVPAETVAAMSVLAREIRRAITLPLGINVLRNDGLSALAIAVAAEAQFVRVNVLTGARLADQGILQGIAHDLSRLRRNLGAERVRIMADVDVKHSAPLAPYGLANEVADAVTRGCADAVIVSGSGTGKPTSLDDLETVRRAAKGVPVFIGSGVTTETARDLLALADGAVVGTAFKQGGKVSAPVDVARVKELLVRLA